MGIAFMNNDVQGDPFQRCTKFNYRVLADVKVGPVSSKPLTFPLPATSSGPEYSLDIDVIFTIYNFSDNRTGRVSFFQKLF